MDDNMILKNFQKEIYSKAKNKLYNDLNVNCFNMVVDNFSLKELIDIIPKNVVPIGYNATIRTSINLAFKCNLGFCKKLEEKLLPPYIDIEEKIFLTEFKKVKKAINEYGLFIKKFKTKKNARKK